MSAWEKHRLTQRFPERWFRPSARQAFGILWAWLRRRDYVLEGYDLNVSFWAKGDVRFENHRGQAEQGTPAPLMKDTLPSGRYRPIVNPDMTRDQ